MSMRWPRPAASREAFKKIEAEKGVDLKTDAGRWTGARRALRRHRTLGAAQTAAEVSAALKKAGALWAPYQSFRELAADKENVLDNPMFTVLDQPGIGRYPVAATPFQFGAMKREPPHVAPVLGQHTDEILSGILGLRTARSAGCMTRRSSVDRGNAPSAVRDLSCGLKGPSLRSG